MEWDRFKPPFTNLSRASRAQWHGKPTMSIFDADGKRVACCMGYPLQQSEQGVKMADELAKILNLVFDRCVVAVLFSVLSVGAVAAPVDYDALFDAIAMVESDNGKTSPNKYQLTRAFCLDLGRITGESWDYASTTRRERRGRLAMRLYWAYYTSRQFNRSGEPVTAELLAKLHRVGYKGLKSKKRTADAYWKRVRKHYHPKSR